MFLQCFNYIKELNEQNVSIVKKELQYLSLFVIMYCDYKCKYVKVKNANQKKEMGRT